MNSILNSNYNKEHMTFISLEFLIFFIVLFVVFYSIKQKFRIGTLFVASLIFLSTYSLAFAFYTLLFALYNFYIGRGIYYFTGDRRKLTYYLGQILNIGGLVFFKYINFIIENVNYTLGFISQGNKLGYLDVLIPVGISYYTFQGISYLYLIYKAKDKPESNFIHLSLFMMFFPKLLAGPIERHRRFLPQLKQKIEFDYDRIVEGGRLVMWGVFKKVVVADQFSIILNKFYLDMEYFSGVSFILVFMMQPVQIYFDFSGYTDMAIGLGKIFGINLSENFNRPFMARSVGEFWRRWHMSLSLWFNDFIYNRLIIKHRKWGTRAVYYAILVSFTLIGLWHGAKWTYVFLGWMQVAALIYEFRTHKYRKKISYIFNPVLLKWLSRIIVYLFFGFSLTFFFADNISDVWYFYRHLFVIRNFSNFHLGFNIIRGEFYLAVFFSIIIMFWDVIREDWNSEVVINIFNNNIFIRWILYFLWLLFVVYLSKNETIFIYMGF